MGISGDLLAFVTQSPADFNEPQRTDDASRQQSHEFTTFGQPFGGHRHVRIRISGNMDSNPRSLWLKQPKFKRPGTLGVGGGVLLEC